MDNTFQPDINIIDFNRLEALPYQDACITIGNFDGVHLGHQAIITRMVRKAQRQNRPVLVVTFYPNPFVYFNHPELPFYLSTPGEKERLLVSLGVERVITLRFDREFANLTAEAFLAELKQKLGLGVLVVGEDFALGKGRQGTIPVLKDIGRQHSFSVEVISRIETAGKEVSSTLVRQALDVGQADQVAELLGRPYQVAGVVTHGSDRGSKIGLPTANISPWAQKKLPAVGVYATLVHLWDQVYQGITNIGVRPTFEDQAQVNVETHILDFDGNIYGEKMNLAFIEKLRDEQKFSGVEAFLAQIERDKATARRIFQHVKT
ncbi:MAG: bifunctional riboflavin kinase/FAD synthetase [Brevefilum sp.]|nr:bifunctional riboflavin kinase/FAD synthetase [Brevefilum sp.]